MIFIPCSDASKRVLNDGGTRPAGVVVVAGVISRVVTSGCRFLVTLFSHFQYDHLSSSRKVVCLTGGRDLIIVGGMAVLP